MFGLTARENGVNVIANQSDVTLIGRSRVPLNVVHSGLRK